LEAAQVYETALALLKDIRIHYPQWKSDAVAQTIRECEQALGAVREPERIPPSAALAIPAVLAPAAAAGAAAPAVVAPPAASAEAAPAAGAPSTAPFVGHAVSKKVHLASCEWAQKIQPSHRVYFNTYPEAAAAGFAACKVCKPDSGASGEAVSAPAAPSTGPASEAVSTAPFIGHKGTKKLHRSDCQYGSKISARNRVYFNTYPEAIAAGYIPCRTCKPDQSFSAAASEPPSSGVAAPPAPDVPAAASGAAESEYLTSGKAKAFHRPSCEWGKKIPADSLVKYATREEAIAAGKNPCKVCNP
jgi:methylphosphotriester-DNA--protein-cysteine methyltransferase